MEYSYKNNLSCINPYNFWFVNDKIHFKIDKIYGKFYRHKFVNNKCYNLIYFGEPVNHINIHQISLLQPQYPETFFESWLLYHFIKPDGNALLLTNELSLGNIESLKIYSELYQIYIPILSDTIHDILYQTIDYSIFNNQTINFMFIDFIDYSETKTSWISQKISSMKYYNNLKLYLKTLDDDGVLVIKYSFLFEKNNIKFLDLLTENFNNFELYRPEIIEPDCPFIYIICTNKSNKNDLIEILENAEQTFIDKKSQLIKINYDSFVKKYNLMTLNTLKINKMYNKGYLNYLKRFIDSKPCFLDNTVTKTNYISWEMFLKDIEPLSGLKYQVGKIIKTNVSNAWLKMYELLSSYNIIPNRSSITTLHLCEAPGTFVSCFNHFIYTRTKSKYIWEANTLPFTELNALTDFYGLIRKYKKNWVMEDVTNMSFILNDYKKYDVITGDGGIHCNPNQYSCQEEITAKLIYMEFLNIIFKLKIHGNAILKMYLPCDLKSNKSIIYLASKMFKFYKLDKPQTSSKCNSEFYLVMLDYIGLHEESTDDFLKIIDNYDNINNYIPGYYSNNKNIMPKIHIIQDMMHNLIEQFGDTIYKYVFYNGKINNKSKIKLWLEKYPIYNLDEDYIL